MYTTKEGSLLEMIVIVWWKISRTDLTNSIPFPFISGVCIVRNVAYFRGTFLTSAVLEKVLSLDLIRALVIILQLEGDIIVGPSTLVSAKKVNSFFFGGGLGIVDSFHVDPRSLFPVVHIAVIGERSRVPFLGSH